MLEDTGGIMALEYCRVEWFGRMEGEKELDREGLVYGRNMSENDAPMLLHESNSP